MHVSGWHSSGGALRRHWGRVHGADEGQSGLMSWGPDLRWATGTTTRTTRSQDQ
jgi:hypothetical protein